MRKSRLDQPLIYFVSALGANAIKIGYASNLKARLAELATGCPFELVPVAAIFDQPCREYAVHTQLAKYRIRGEWFDDAPEVWQYIEAHADWIVGKDDLLASVPLGEFQVASDHDFAHQWIIVGSIREAFNRAPLSSRQRQVLSLRFGLDGSALELTLAEVGRALGLTYQRVQQIECAGLQALARNKAMAGLR